MQDNLNINNTKKCSNCKYYTVNATNLNSGFCYRYPPTVTVLGADQMNRIITDSFYPPVGSDKWCGEFATKVVLN